MNLPPRGPQAGGPPSFELQFHPAGSRLRVRYLRLNRGLLTLGSIVVLLYLFLLAFAAGVAPGVAAALFGSEEYRVLAAERARQGERLLALVGRLEQLRGRSEGLLQQVHSVSVAYGLKGVPENAANDGEAAAMGAPPPASTPGSIYASTIQQGERLQLRVRSQIDAVEAGLAEVRAFEGDHAEAVRETPAACPLRGDRFVLTAPFGRQRSGFTHDLSLHAGIDLAAPRGTEIVAPADGVVVFAGTYPLARSPVWWRFGNLVAVAHGDRFLSLYGHCGEIKVTVGRRVQRGDTLGTVGSSGWSVSPQLHYEVRKRDASGELVPVDPLLYILDRRWSSEERPAPARAQAPLRGYEPLPPGLDRMARGGGVRGGGTGVRRRVGTG